MKIKQLNKDHFYFISIKVEPFDFEDYTLYHSKDETLENVKFYAERSVITQACIGYINKQTLVVKKFEGNEKSILENIISSMEKFEGRKFAGWSVANTIIPFIIKRSVINGLGVPSILDLGDIKPWADDFLELQKLWSFGAINYPDLNEVHKALVKEPIQTEVEDIYKAAEVFLRVVEGTYIENVEVRNEENKTN